MRLLSLASWLSKTDWKITFCSKECDQKLIDKIKSEKIFFLLDRNPFDLKRKLPHQDIVFIDDYSISKEEWKKIENLDSTTVVLDDATSDHPLPVDIVVNPAPNIKAKQYLKRTKNSALLLGPQFTILRKDFSRLKAEKFIKRTGILITLGGSENNGLDFALAKALCGTFSNERIIVILGPMIKKETIKKMKQLAVKHNNLSIVLDCFNLEKYMTNVAMAVCAGGSTLGELAVTGTPTVAVCLTANQSLMLSSPLRNTWYFAHDAINFKDLSGRKEKLIVAEILESINLLLNNYDVRKTMGEKARNIVDAFGCERIIQKTLDFHLSKTKV